MILNLQSNRNSRRLLMYPKKDTAIDGTKGPTGMGGMDGKWLGEGSLLDTGAVTRRVQELIKIKAP